MKKLWTIIAILLCFQWAEAQQTEGKVIYEYLMKGGKSTVTINGESQTFERPDHTIRLELLFGNGQSLLQPLEDERPEEESAVSGGRGMTVRFRGGPGTSGITWHHFLDARRVEQQETMGKKFLISDSIYKQNWKITGVTKTILGIPCQQATTTVIATSKRMMMQDGEMKREDVTDTTEIIAWFAPSIPVSAGPDYQGQLPGLILELNLPGKTSVIRAVEISPKVNLSSIKAPTGGKKVTRAEYKKEMDALTDEMIKRGPPAPGRARPAM